MYMSLFPFYYSSLLPLSLFHFPCSCFPLLSACLSLSLCLSFCVCFPSQIFSLEYSDGIGHTWQLVFQTFTRFVSISAAPVIVGASAAYVLVSHFMNGEGEKEGGGEEEKEGGGEGDMWV